MSQFARIAPFLRSCARFRGRESRSEYWRIMRVVFAAPAVLFIVIILALGVVSGYAVILAAIPLCLFLVLASSPFWLAATVRRLHDTDRSAVWLLIYIVVTLGWVALVAVSVWGYGVLLEASSEDDHTEGFELVGWTFIVIAIGGFWSLISLAGMGVLIAVCNRPGAIGPNRYGPDPLQPDAEGNAPDIPRSGVPLTAPRSETGLPRSHGRSRGRYCSQCGMQLQPEARFCTACGAAV